MEFFYDPHITAISRKGISAPLKFLLENELIYKGEKILDFGAGKLKDTDWLNENGYNCKAYDKYHDDHKISDIEICKKNKFNVLFSIYVFNVIETKDEFKETLKLIREINAERKYIAIRNDFKAIKPNWEYSCDNDNYFTGRTHQRFIKDEDLQSYFGDHSVLKITSTFKIIKLK